jgi:hypothetical protein
MIFTLATTDVEAKKDKPAEIDAAIFLVPMNDALKIDAGTIEVIFSLDYSFDSYLRPDESNCTPFTFLGIYNKDFSQARDKDDGVILASAHQGTGSHGMTFATNYYYWETKEPQPFKGFGIAMVNPVKEKGTWIEEGECHSVAVTWKVESDGLHTESFFDGKSQAKRIFPLKDTNTRPFSKDDLIGIGGYNLSAGSILSYRLSNKVRTGEEIAEKGPLKQDEATTFLLNAESAAKCAKFDKKDMGKMIKNGKLDIKKNGAFFGNYKIVDTPNGKAIQFYNKRSR